MKIVADNKPANIPQSPEMRSFKTFKNAEKPITKENMNSSIHLNSLTHVIIYVITIFAVLPSWVESSLEKCNRKKEFIHFHPHAEFRSLSRCMAIDRIVETVMYGKVFGKKCSYPDKIAFQHYFNDGFTYVVITKLFPNSFQVKTVWKKRGRI